MDSPASEEAYSGTDSHFLHVGIYVGVMSHLLTCRRG